ncbi:MAG: ABC transporter permease, partial [Clostridiaceae bacterium]|nr:ABC transporter permease [Clostridiaceae bacterium]
IQNGGNPSLKEVVDSGILSTRGTAFVESFLLQLLFIIACCALVFLISSIFKSSMTTMAISVIICVASSIIFMTTSLKKVAHLVFLNYGATPSVVGGDIAQLYNNPNFSVGLGISLMCGTIIISYILATLIFNKKDMLI